MAALPNPAFWNGRRVLLTGHSGFKGSWCALWLQAMGAKVHGLSLAPETDPNLFGILGLGKDIPDPFGDIRDIETIRTAVAKASPQIVLHMAAQPLVRRSVRAPVPTFDTNVMGTVNLLEALRDAEGLEAVLIITTDKVYENPETGRAFRETDPLGGHDPYSASKAAAEIVTASYRRTYFEPTSVPLATARGGNVIGGGDFSEDRIVPDIWRAQRAGMPLELRNPNATRPWQHVLDCLAGYLAYAEALALKQPVPTSLNFGPLLNHPVPVSALAQAMQQALGGSGEWSQLNGPKMHEMQALALDVTVASEVLGFEDRLVGHAAIAATADWYLAFDRGEDMRALTLRAIEDYCAK